MSDPRRALFAQGTIALAVCLGGYMAFVDPVKQDLAGERSKADTLAAQVGEAEAVRDQVPQITAALQTATAEADALLQLGDLARDERRLYAAVMAAAQEHRVQIDQLNPSKIASPVRPGGKEDPAAAGDIALGYSIAAAGTYANLAGFMRTLQTELGFAMVRSATLGPRGEAGEDQVRAIIDTAHFFFDPAPPAAPGAPAQRVADAAGGH